MLPSASTVLVRRGHSRHLLAALLFAVGCSGTGSSCGSSCGGAVVTTLPDGGPIEFGRLGRLDNAIQLRLTNDAFTQLNANTLNQVVGGLSDAGSVASLPCIGDTLLSYGSGCYNIPGVGLEGTQLTVLLGDSNFDYKCDTSDATPFFIKFNSVTWTLDPVNQILHAQIFVNIRSGDFYVRTAEAHSSVYSDSANNPAPFQGDVIVDDRNTIAGHTELDIDLQFTRAPDGRLLIMPTQASLDAILSHLDIVNSIYLSGNPGEPSRGLAPNPAPPQYGQLQYNGCDTDTTPYLTMNGSQLTGSGWTLDNLVSCDPNASSPSTECQIYFELIGYLEGFLQNQFQTQIVSFLQQQIDNVVCVRPINSSGTAVACGSGNPCPADDDGNPETCDPNFGVCLAQGQDAGTGVCEPVALALQGQLNLANLTQTVGFPAGTAVDFFAGLGGKTAADTIDDGGVQLSAVSGTKPASTVVPALCVPPTTFPPITTNGILALNFDDPNNQPDGGVGTYDVGIGLAGAALNQASYDAFNAGVFCIQISNQTSSFVSTQLFKTFLPSLGLLTHGQDAPMAILLRPTLAPSVRVGRGTLTENTDGTFSPDDPLITLSLPSLNLDFYAVIDERWVRLFTLQTDVTLPLGLRTFAGTQADTLQPVLGSLTTVLTNITASDNVMLAEDPSVVTNLLGAVVQFAQPLLAGVLAPIPLPSLLGLQLQVKGVAGAVPASANVTQDGYEHLAIWAGFTSCGGTGQPACSNRTTRTEARLVESDLPASVDEIRGPEHKIPAAIIEAQAFDVVSGQPEFSYRIDGGLWSPWTHDSRITIRNPMFFVQGHHKIEVTSRDSGDDRTQDREPAVVDFFSSYTAPAVSLVQLNDGSVVTHARSESTEPSRLRYSYRIGQGAWTSEGERRTFSAGELGGSDLAVRVSDERGLSSEASLNTGL